MAHLPNGRNSLLATEPIKLERPHCREVETHGGSRLKGSSSKVAENLSGLVAEDGSSKRGCVKRDSYSKRPM